MSIAYIPPGVTVQELTSPSITPLLAVPGSICLVGMASGAIVRTEPVVLLGNTEALLTGVPRDSAGNMLATLDTGFTFPVGNPTGTTFTATGTYVIDALNPSIAPNGYSGSTDFTLDTAGGGITRKCLTNTLNTNVSSGATTVTLAAGAAPAVGRTIRLTNITGSVTTTETVVALTSVGQTFTIAAPGLINSYTSSGTVVSWSNGLIPDGASVYITYAYTPNDYYQPIRLNSMADIQTRFGNAWDPSNQFINSQLSFAAGLAFQNGASNVVLQPLFVLNGSGQAVQPTTSLTVSSQAGSAATWASVFTSLQSLEDINIIVPVVGQAPGGQFTDSLIVQIEQAAQDMVFQMLNADDQYIIAIVGEDSSLSTTSAPLAQEAALTIHAATLIPRYAAAVTQQLVFVNTASHAVPTSQATPLAVGGQYMAAAIAGMLSARSPASTLTRQVVSGFSDVKDQRSKSAKNADAGNGMLVVEAKSGVVQVRHGITMDSTSVATRELNVVRAKHYVIESVQITLDSQVIGSLIADTDAPTIVNNVVIGVLEDLRALSILSSYANVASRITAIDPTTMEVRFDYQPAFVVNYINIAFSIDLTTQTITVDTSGTAS